MIDGAVQKGINSDWLGRDALAIKTERLTSDVGDTLQLCFGALQELRAGGWQIGGVHNVPTRRSPSNSAD